MYKSVLSGAALFMLIAVFALNNVYAQGHDPRKDKITPAIAEIKIKTSAICESCKSRIEKAVMKVSGVESANLDLETKEVKVTYNPGRTEPDQIKKAITKAGYNADDMKADAKAYKKLPACCKAEK